jgi:uncharacterized protein (TIGR03067 family)
MQALMLFTACTVNAPVLKDKAPPAPIGEWIVESAESDTVESDLVGVRVTIEERQLTFAGDGVDDVFVVIFSSNHGVGQIDLISKTDGPPLTGIYKIEGDKLSLCINESRELDRPTQFKAAKDVARIVLKKSAK